MVSRSASAGDAGGPTDASGDERFCTIGAACAGRPKVLVFAGDSNKVIIGAFATIADDVEIFVGGNHRADWVTVYPLREMYQLPGAFEGNPWSRGDVVIGEGVTIGRGARVMSGTTIGDGADIRPFAIVTGDVPALTIVEGSPAREIGRRSEHGSVEAVAWLSRVRSRPTSNTPAVGSSVELPMSRRDRVAALRLVRHVGAAAAKLRRQIRLYGESRSVVRGAVRDPHLEMGRGSYFVPTVHAAAPESKVTIGKYSSIAHDTEMVLEPLLPSEGVSAVHPPQLAPGEAAVPAQASMRITVGNDAWLGRGTKVVGPVSVGDGAVIAAFSVVTEDVPPYAIVAGNPARVIGSRFKDDLIQALLDIRWWDWPERTVNDRWADLCSPDVRGFVERYRPEAASE